MPASLCTGRKGLRGTAQEDGCAVRKHRETTSGETKVDPHISDKFSDNI